MLPVSAIIPAYNRARLLPRALESIVRQRARPAEVIVVDDGSADDTAEVAERMGATVIRHPHNRGLAATRNTAIRAATQPWVASLDSDDRWLPHALEKLWALHDGHVLVAGAGFTRAQTPAGEYVGGMPTRRPQVLRSPAPLVAYSNFIGPSSVLLRRDAVLDAGAFDEGLARIGEAEDMDLWIRLLERGTAIFTPEVVTVYYTVGEGAGSVQTDREMMLSGHEKVVARYAERPWCTRTLVERSRGLVAWERLRAALRERQPQRALEQARAIVRSRGQLAGVAGIVLWRQRQRRRRWTVSREGLPTVALLPGVSAGETAERPEGASVVDLRSRSRSAALLRLARRPTAEAYVSSPAQAAIVRLLGARPTRAPGRS